MLLPAPAREPGEPREILDSFEMRSDGKPLHIRGRVTGADGAPAEGAWVRLLRPATGRTMDSDRAALGGLFELEVDEVGSYELRAGGGVFGQASRPLTVTAEDLGAELSWDPLLDRGREITGRLVDGSGQPLKGFTVEFQSAHDPGWGDVTLAAGGDFALPNLPGGGRLLLTAPGSRLPAHVVPGVWPDGAPLELELSAAQLATGAVELDASWAEREARPEVRLWQLATGRGLWMSLEPPAEPADDQPGRYRQAGLPPGTYRATAGSLARGYADLGLFEVVADETTLLAPPPLPAPGRLTWEPVDDGPSEGAVWMLLHRGPAVDHVVAENALLRPMTDALPAGAYLFAVEGTDFAVPARPLQVRAGEPVTLEPSLATHREVLFRIATERPGTPWLTVFDAIDSGDTPIHTGPAPSPLRLHLPPGKYRASALLGDHAAERGFEVGDQAIGVKLLLR